MARRKYKHEWNDLAFIDSDFIGGWGAFKGYDGPLEFDGCTPSKAHAIHDVERDTFSVVYALRDGDDTVPTVCPVRLERAACNYGGARVYFRAPCCSRRVRKLALLPQGLRCARCGSITNTSKRKSGTQRLIHKAGVLASELECVNWYSAPTERPKGMRRETFNRKADEHAKLVSAAMGQIRPRLARAGARGGIAAQMGAALRYGL